MFLPQINEYGTKNFAVQSFGGLDTRPKAAFASMKQMLNLSSDAYPAVIPSENRRQAVVMTGISAIAAPEYTDTKIDSFTGVKDKDFYYCGTKISGSLKTAGQKSIADFNGKLCIFPDKMYYNYLPDSETGVISNKLESMEKTISAAGISFYSSYNSITGYYTAYLQKSNAGFDIFCSGDSVTISECSASANNTCTIGGTHDYADGNAIISAVVKSASAGKLELLLYNKNGGKAVFTNTTESGTVTVKAYIPDMNHVCVHNNRLWGTAENGEYIYASKLGDCTNFNSFQGLGDDSWYCRIGTPGGFTGICSYRTSVVAFKQNFIHHVYGDSPKNFSVPKQTMTGCIDGRSIAELSGILYYLSAGGFCAYSGGEPYKISSQLSDNYVACAAGANEKKYYAAAYKSDGSCDVLVYDPECNMWHREDDTRFTRFIRYGGSLYAASDTGVWEFCSSGRTGSWSFTLNPITYDSFEHKAPDSLRLRIDSGTDTEIKISISHDGGKFIEYAHIKGKGFAVHRIPIRFKKCDSFSIRVDGSGYAVIHGLETTTYRGGKTYAK